MHDAQHITNRIKGKALLAPMLGTTDIPFRLICREFGAALTYTEMVSAAGILRSSSHSYRNAVFSSGERPIALQLVAADPANAAAAARILRPLEPEVFDINCGCPNDRICEAGAGAQLLDDLPRFAAIIEATVRATPIPVAVKVRMRGQHARSDIRDIVRAAQDSGAVFIVVHARARNVEYAQPAQWEALASAASVARIPLVGNGDIFSAADAFRMMDETGCDAVMVARGSLGTPWLFRDVAEGRRCTLSEHAPDNNELRALLASHLSQTLREYGSVRALPRMRKHTLWYGRRFEGFEDLRKTVFATDCAEEMITAAKQFFSDERRPLDPDNPEFREREMAFRERVLFWAKAVLRTDG